MGFSCPSAGENTITMYCTTHCVICDTCTSNEINHKPSSGEFIVNISISNGSQGLEQFPVNNFVQTLEAKIPDNAFLIWMGSSMIW